MTAAEVDTIEADLIQAFADRKGARTITHEGQTVTFQDWTEAAPFIERLRRMVRVSTGQSNIRYAATSKGFQ